MESAIKKPFGTFFSYCYDPIDSLGLDATSSKSDVRATNNFSNINIRMI